MVLPRWRDEGEALKERFRRETETRLRSRRFYWEVQYGPLMGERCGCALHMGAAKVCPDEQEDRWRVARAGRKAWRPFIPTIRVWWRCCRFCTRGMRVNSMELYVCSRELPGRVEELQSNGRLALIKCGEARERASGQGVVELFRHRRPDEHQESISPRRRHWTETVRNRPSHLPLYQSLAHIRQHGAQQPACHPRLRPRAHTPGPLFIHPVHSRKIPCSPISSIDFLLTNSRTPPWPDNSPTPAPTPPSPICARISGALFGPSRSRKASTQTLKAATSSRN